MQFTTGIFAVFTVAALLQFAADTADLDWMNNYNIERELALLAIDLTPIADIDLVQCVKLLLSAAKDDFSCDEETIECQVIMIGFDLMLLIDVDPVDVVGELLGAILGS